MSKFDTLFEAQIGRFIKSGPIAGDYIKFKSDLKTSDWYKSLDEARKSYVDNIITISEEGKPVMLSTIKKAVYETETTDSDKQLADIAVEISPGFYAEKLTIPLELLEFDISSADARGTQKDETNNQKDNVSLKPEVHEDKEIEVGQQTKVPNGDYELSTAKYISEV
tara:strand:+ start:1109 stop:1609 length:501 start_codon:yes stop_codon:yes gene_type:complete